MSKEPSKANREGARPLLDIVVRSAPNGIVVSDGTGKIVLANQKAEELFGYTSSELLALRVEDLLPKEIRQRHESHRKDFARKSSARAMGVGRDLYALHKDGTEFPVEIGLSPVETEGGRMVVATVIDISERQKADETVRRQAEILDNVHDAVFLADPKGIIQTWNEGAERVYGFSAEEAIGASVKIFLPEEDQGRYLEKTYPRLLDEGSCDFVDWSVHKSGKRIAVAVRASLLRRRDGKPEGAVVCAHDITQQKMLEQKVIEVSESEQRRIGQDIHDDLCQQLASIGCLTKVLEQRLQENFEEEAEHLAQIGEMVSQANVRAREIARGLVPSTVESEGLTGALEELAGRTRKVFGVECEFHCAEAVELPVQASMQLYRIAQEAVSNAVRHGQPEEVSLFLEQHADELVLRIVDDGKGMAQTTGSSGLGLLTMAHRAQMLGGEFRIQSGSGQGTRIECVIKYPYQMIES